MLQKQIFLMMVCTAALFLLAGCGKEKTKSAKKPIQTVKTPETKKVKAKTDNIVDNPSFEKAKIFDKGLYKKGKFPAEKPAGWATGYQVLDDFAGWATDEAHTGKRSLKIENTGGTMAHWKGKTIIFKKSANAFKTSIWTRVKEIKDKTGSGRFQLAFDVYLKGKNGKEIEKKIAVTIPKTDHDWKKTEEKILFPENIIKVTPYLYFSGIIGNAWFDDFHVSPINIGLSKKKVLFDSNNKKSTFNIPPFSTKINPRHLSADLSAAAKALALEEQATIYEVKGQKTVISSDFIPVKEGEVYRLSGDFKVVNNEPSRLFFGYALYTKDKKIILRRSVEYIKNTDTELVKGCKASDKIIYIKNAENWETGRDYLIAFVTDSSGKYSDLPNLNLSSMGIEKIEKSNNYYKIVLKKPCRKNYPAGTKIREHVSGDARIYNAVSGETISASTKDLDHFKNFTNLIVTDNLPFMSKLYPKTKYVRLFMRANCTTPKATLRFKNIKMEAFNIIK